MDQGRNETVELGSEYMVHGSSVLGILISGLEAYWMVVSSCLEGKRDWTCASYCVPD